MELTLDLEDAFTFGKVETGATADSFALRMVWIFFVRTLLAAFGLMGGI